MFLLPWCAPYFSVGSGSKHTFSLKRCVGTRTRQKRQATGHGKKKALASSCVIISTPDGRKTTYSSQFPLSRICCCWGLRQKNFFLVIIYTMNNEPPTPQGSIRFKGRHIKYSASSFLSCHPCRLSTT